MSGIFERMLSAYDTSTDTAKRNATYEVMQQVALAGLQRGGFFEKAAFYGARAYASSTAWAATARTWISHY